MGEKMSLAQVRDQIAAVATEDDYMLQGWIAAIDAHLAQPAQGRGEAVVGAKGKFISESGYCFSGTLDSVLYKVWLNDGSLVTIGRDEFILDANPTRSSPAVAPDDERLHSGSAEDVAQWLYANGHHDAAFTVRQQLDVRNERIRALESTQLAQPAQAVDVGAIREVIERTRKYYEVTDNCRNDPAMESELSDIHEVLTRALSGEKAGPVDGWRATMRLGVEAWEKYLETGGGSPVAHAEFRKTVAEFLSQANALLPASPTPGKEQA